MADFGQAGQDAIGLGTGFVPKVAPAPDSAKLGAAELAKAEQAQAEVEKQRTAQLAPQQASLEAKQTDLSGALAKGAEHQDVPKMEKFTPTDIQNNMGVLLALAAFSGMASRQPLTASLTAMAGMIEGVKQGDDTRFQRDFKTYDENMRGVIEKNRQYEKEFDRIVKSKELSVSQQAEQIRLLNIQFDKQIAKTASDAGHHLEVIKLGQKDIEINNKAAEALLRIKEMAAAKEQAHQDRLAIAGIGGPGSSGLTPEGQKVLEELIKAGKPVPKTRRGMRDDETLNMMGAHQEGGAGSGTIVGAQAEYKANSAAYTQITKDLAAIRPYKVMLDTNADIAKQLAEKIGKKDSSLANKTINWFETHLSDDADVGEYLAQIHFVSTEAARVLSNPRLVGQLSDSARHEMDDVISGSMPLNMTKRILDRMKTDGDNRVNAMTSEAASLKKSLGGGAGKPAPASNAPPPPPGFKPL